MCSCSAWCIIARRVPKPNICRLLMLHCLWEHGCEPEISFPNTFLCLHAFGNVGVSSWMCWRIQKSRKVRCANGDIREGVVGTSGFWEKCWCSRNQKPCTCGRLSTSRCPDAVGLVIHGPRWASPRWGRTQQAIRSCDPTRRDGIRRMAHWSLEMGELNLIPVSYAQAVSGHPPPSFC